MMSLSPSVTRDERGILESTKAGEDVLKNSGIDVVETAFSRFADMPHPTPASRRRRKAYGSSVLEHLGNHHPTSNDLMQLTSEILQSTNESVAAEIDSDLRRMDEDDIPRSDKCEDSETDSIGMDKGEDVNASTKVNHVIVAGIYKDESETDSIENDKGEDVDTISAKVNHATVAGNIIAKHPEGDAECGQEDECVEEVPLAISNLVNQLKVSDVTKEVPTEAQKADDMLLITEQEATATVASPSELSRETNAVDENEPPDGRSTSKSSRRAKRIASSKLPKKGEAIEQPDENDLVASIDNLFIHADKLSVTVGDIVRSIEVEYAMELNKATRKKVRNRLTDLITGKIEPSVSGYVDNVGEVGDAESEAGTLDKEDDEADGEQSDFEDDEMKTNRTCRKARRKNEKRRVSKPRRNKQSPKKSAMLRIKAEKLRKRQMEELKVRNEELQLNQSKEDQERAELIAAKFETNTDELRLKRLEDRLDLLAKLDKKRIDIIQEHTVVKEEVILTLPKAWTEEHEVPPTLALGKGVELEPVEQFDSEDEMELEIVGTSKPSAFAQLKPSRKLLSNDLVASVAEPSWSFRGSQPQTSPRCSLRARASLRQTLLAKQRKAGNMWLARELGYKTEEEHLRDCLLVEQKKRAIVLKNEEERHRANERKLLRQRLLMDDPANVDGNESGADGEQKDDEAQEEDDEELALAKEIQDETFGDDDDEGSRADESHYPTLPDMIDNLDTVNFTRTKGDLIKAAASLSGAEGSNEIGSESMDMPLNDDDDDDDKTVAFNADTATDAYKFDTQPPMLGVASTLKKCQPITAASLGEAADEEWHETELRSGELQTADLSENPALNISAEPHESDSGKGGSDIDVGDPDPALNISAEPRESDSGKGESRIDVGNSEAVSKVNTKKGPRNAAWQAMLRKEAQQIKKMKMRKGGLVEAEAEEEEEEEVAGLEDFGFLVRKTKKDDDEEENIADKLDEDDLEHIVDDVSDNEGDEEAGENARKALEQQEEKLRHKEVLRRMRDGYDGRRGGITGSGFGARGIHRFDQLVAADNREDAKMLGLLNDDELDSEDEKTGDKDGRNEDDDEVALLDKVLKDRFLHRSSVDLEENFSEDEEDDDEKAENNGPAEEDDEENEQERLAKRFAKRARMHRLLELHGEEEEFSRSRLIDEDETIRQELSNMKNGHLSKRTVSASSSSRSDSVSGSYATSTAVGQVTRAFGAPLGKGATLCLALQSSRRSKTKTSFLGNKTTSGKDVGSSMSKFVARGGHVLFHTAASTEGHSSLSNSARSNNGTKHAPSSDRNHTTAGKRKRNAVGAPSSSLWNKVSSNSFRKRT